MKDERNMKYHENNTIISMVLLFDYGVIVIGVIGVIVFVIFPIVVHVNFMNVPQLSWPFLFCDVTNCHCG